MTSRSEPTSQNQEALAKVCAMRCDMPNFPEPNTSIGFLKDNNLVAGVTFSGYTMQNIWMSMWADNPYVFTRSNIRTIFEYVFGDCKCERVSVIVKRDNKKSLSLVRKLGFTQEGEIRRLFGQTENDDGIVFGMLKQECRWL